MSYLFAVLLAAAHAADRYPGAARDEKDRRAAATGEQGSGKTPGEKMVWGDMDGYKMSEGLPSRMTEQEESGPRFKVARSWQPDGEVIDGEEIALAAEGGLVSAKMRSKLSFSPGETLAVYRLSLAKDSDEDRRRAISRKSAGRRWRGDVWARGAMSRSSSPTAPSWPEIGSRGKNHDEGIYYHRHARLRDLLLGE